MIKKTDKNMYINKKYFRDSLSFLFVAAVFFVATTDAAFPFIMFMIKAVFYIFGTLLLFLGVKTLWRSFFRKRENR